jgi:hypothetical protein
MSRPIINAEASASVREQDNQWTVDGFYHRSDRDAFYRQHAAQRAREERQDRAERWLADRLSGLTFASFDTLATTALNTFQNYAGRLATEDERKVLEDAARCLWAGVSLRQRTALELDAVGYVQALTFKAA